MSHTPDLVELERVTPIVESRFGLDGGAMFGVIPKPLWSRTNPADDANRIALAARCLVLEGGGRTVLLDVGMGQRWSDKERGIYAVDHGGHTLHSALQAAGIAPEAITDVVLTHLHFDHAGGLTEVGADGSLRATFPQATHWLQRENWVWAHHPTVRDAGSYRRDDFALLGAPGGPRLELVDGTSRLLGDLLEVIPSHGHTPGLQMVRFCAPGGTTVLYVSDVLPTRGHLNLAYVMGYDLHPLVTVREKHELLENALHGDWVLALEHDPEAGFVRVERAGPDRYRVAAAAPTLTALA